MKNFKKDYFNYYTIHNIISKVMRYIPVATSAFIAYFFRNSWIFGVIFLITLSLTVYCFKKYTIAKPVSKRDIKSKYLYHCLSKEKLEKVINGDTVHLKRTTDKWHNISTLFKNSVYFHSSLRGNSFLYNHGYRYKKIDYVLIIPIENLSDNLLMRKCDGAIIDLEDYKGKAKCISINKIDIYKKVNNKYIGYVIRDYFQSWVLFTNVFMPVMWGVVKGYQYLGIL